MGLEDILETIRAEAEATAADLLSAAQAESERTLHNAEQVAAREEQASSLSLDDRASLERSKIISRAHLEASREKRAAREGLYQAALQATVRRLEVVRVSEGYAEVLSALLDEAIAVLPEAVAVQVDPMDAAILRRILEDRQLELRVEEQTCELGGLMLTADRRVLDNRVRSRLDRADRHLRFLAGELVPALRGGAP